MSIKKYDLNINGNKDIPLNQVTRTTGIAINRVVETWSVVFEFAGSPDADPIVTVEGSNDNQVWTSAYNVNTKITSAYSDGNNGVNSIKGTRFEYQYFRIKTQDNFATQGTMTGTLNLLYDEQ